MTSEMRVWAAKIETVNTELIVTGFLAESYGWEIGTALVETLRAAGKQADLVGVEPDWRYIPELVPRQEELVYKTWYRSLNSDGTLWCESSDPAEVIKASANKKSYFEKLEKIQYHIGWVPWNPQV